MAQSAFKDARGLRRATSPDPAYGLLTEEERAKLSDVTPRGPVHELMTTTDVL